MRRESQCASCWNWLPHAHYPFLGYCLVWREVTFEDQRCPSYTPVSVEIDRFYWCATCKARLSREEAISHWSEGHRLYRSAFIEPDVREEIYEG